MESVYDLSHVRFEGKPVATGARALVRRVSAPQGGRLVARDDGPLDEFIRWTLQQAHLDADLYRARPLMRRLPACLRMLRARSTAEARTLLSRRPELLSVAVSALVIGVTEFFRDESVFAVLRERVIPALAAKGCPPRVWSAGCSTGEELMSLAMLLAEAGLLEGSRLLGTDCRADAVEQARSGVFGESVACIGPDLVARHFEPVGQRWRLRECLRRQMQWNVADLARQVEPGPWDLILWRNVAIYLAPEVAAQLAGRLVQSLACGGFLVLGKAERPPQGSGLTAVCRCVYRKHANPGDSGR